MIYGTQADQVSMSAASEAMSAADNDLMADMRRGRLLKKLLVQMRSPQLLSYISRLHIRTWILLAIILGMQIAAYVMFSLYIEREHRWAE